MHIRKHNNGINKQWRTYYAFVLLILGIIQTTYNFVKKEFEERTFHLILSISFALILFFDGDTLWFKIGTIMLFGTIIFQIYKAYK